MAKKLKVASSLQINISAADLSSVTLKTSEEDQWLRKLAYHANTGELTISLSGQKTTEPEPLLRFDTCTNSWWTGRYIGELQFEGGTLRITPRFGDVQLSRWLSRIWGVQITTVQGQYRQTKVWIWHLLAQLWQMRLLAAAKHGLPRRRTDEVHVGTSIRGRLDVRSSVKQFIGGKQLLVSRSREKGLDQTIASVLTLAWTKLNKEIAGDHKQVRWLSPHAEDLVMRMRAEGGNGISGRTPGHSDKIRYTPITESYRPAVALSLSILASRGVASTTTGTSKVLGALIDMAEVWELYLYHLLRAALPEFSVRHTGRDQASENYLFRSPIDPSPLGGLKPDILVYDRLNKQLVAVLDAKYKTTTPSPDRPRGILREDLYQLNAYLSAYGRKSGRITGALIYPESSKHNVSANLQQLSAFSPYLTVATNASAYFLSVNQDDPGEGIPTLTASELDLAGRLGDIFRASKEYQAKNA